MRADPIVLYAVGGGTGHALRGLLLQQALRDSCRQSPTLIIRAGSLPSGCRPAGRVLETATGVVSEEEVAAGGTLLVDTFPDGWLGRFSVREQRRRFRRRLLLARAVFGGRRALPGVETFDRVAVPYSADADEWGDELPDAMPLGFILRETGWRLRRVARLFTVVDPTGRCGEDALRVFRKAADRAGFRFGCCPGYGEEIAGEKVLFIGAGYHTFYEALRQGADARFLPVPKRWDDQAARARRYGLLLETPAQLLAWLRSPCIPPTIPPGVRDDFRPAAHGFVLEEP